MISGWSAARPKVPQFEVESICENGEEYGRQDFSAIDGVREKIILSFKLIESAWPLSRLPDGDA